jgi:hypothetical protein
MKHHVGHTFSKLTFWPESKNLGGEIITIPILR